MIPGVVASRRHAVAPVEEYDPYWGNVVSLLRFNGPDGSTDIVDDKGIVWTANGDAKISTAQARFGGSSLRLDGAGDFIVSAADAAMARGTVDFTVEAWVRTAVAKQSYIFDTSPGNRGAIQISEGGGRYSYYDPNTGISGGPYSGPLVSATLNQWIHIAATRQGGVVRTFLNGDMWGERGSTYNLDGQVAYIGRYGGNNNYHFDGFIDSVRVTKGVARYTSNFTTPNSPFPTVGPP